jgi:hypothetical protein
MRSHFDGLEVIQNRLLKLETQNRRLKQFGVAMLIASTSLIAMGQASSKKIIEANEFILRDESGNVRAKLAVNPSRLGGAPEMFFFDERGRPRVELDGGPGRSTDGGGAVTVYDGQGLMRGFLVATVSTGAILSIVDPHKASEHIGEAVLSGGMLSVSDAKGFSAALGVQALETSRTGETQTTSAASLMLFDKNKNVIWKAP